VILPLTLRTVLVVTLVSVIGSLLAFDTPEVVMRDATVQTAYLGEPL